MAHISPRGAHGPNFFGPVRPVGKKASAPPVRPVGPVEIDFDWDRVRNIKISLKIQIFKKFKIDNSDSA